MKNSIKYINALRFLILLVSFIGLGCHVVQCILLNEYQDKTHIPNWLTEGHWQYFTWYILFSVSIVSALAVCVNATCCKRGHVLRGDKCLGAANIAISITIIVANALTSGQEPWTYGIVEFKEPAKGFMTYCSLLNQEHDATYPLLMQRCLLVDCTYVVSVAVCLLWIILVVIACMVKPNKRISDNSTAPVLLPNENEKEHAWKLSSNYINRYPNTAHINRLELPTSYDPYNQPSRHQAARYSMLARQYPPPSTATIPGAYASPANVFYNS